MSIIIDADILDIGKVIKVNKKFLTIERGRFIIEIFMMEMVERFFLILIKIHMASFSLTM